MPRQRLLRPLLRPIYRQLKMAEPKARENEGSKWGELGRAFRERTLAFIVAMPVAAITYVFATNAEFRANSVAWAATSEAFTRVPSGWVVLAVTALSIAVVKLFTMFNAAEKRANAHEAAQKECELARRFDANLIAEQLRKIADQQESMQHSQDRIDSLSETIAEMFPMLEQRRKERLEVLELKRKSDL